MIGAWGHWHLRRFATPTATTDHPGTGVLTDGWGGSAVGAVEPLAARLGQRGGGAVMVQKMDRSLDRVTLVLLAGAEVTGQVRRFVRRFMESSGAHPEAKERLVQLAPELWRQDM